MLYAAVAATLIAALKIFQSWGRTAALVFVALNGLMIVLLPAGKMLGLLIAGIMLYLLRSSKPKPSSGDA